MCIHCKMKNATALLFLLVGVAHCTGECCKRTYIEWSADSCWPYDQTVYVDAGDADDLMASMVMPTRCNAKVCGDGRVHDGFYCGKGKCNVFGCNCDGGCIPGDAVNNFRKLDDNSNAGAGFTIWDLTTWG
jgi:hypothetical protein